MTDLPKIEMERCEWDPVHNCASDGMCQCPNAATVCVGSNGLWHLCASCAALPRFKRFKKTPLRRPRHGTSSPRAGWIGVYLDGTLAHYDHWRGPEHIGEPIPLMLERVRKWVAEGKDVRIFTARVDGGEAALSQGNSAGEQYRDIERVRRFIEHWCLKHVGVVLPVTCKKDYGLLELWDDRAIGVVCNTGTRTDGIED